MRHLLITLFLISALFKSASAQTTVIPDTNFRNYLIRTLPFYMNPAKELVNSLAATYTGSINCPFNNISDLTGIEKFINLTNLYCHDNNITNIDGVKNLTKLTILHFDRNKVTSLPDLSALTKLNMLYCSGNKLVSFPDLSKNNALTYLDCFNNQLSEIKGIEKLINLEIFNCYDNAIDTFPDLSNLKKLTVFQCFNNKLKVIPGLNNLTGLTMLLVGNNPFDSLQDLTALTKLQQLHLWNCRLTKLPKVSNGTLKELVANHNLLSELPDFSKFPILNKLQVENNRLTFEDLNLLMNNNSFNTFTYSPQEKIKIDTIKSVSENQKFEWVLGIDKKIKKSVYSWYKNGELVKTSFSDTFLISKTSFSDSGFYQCKISNPYFSMLTLSTSELKLIVEPCISLSNLEIQTTNYDCNIGGSITINEATIKGGTAPFTYSVSSSETGKKYFAYLNTITNLFESNYKLEISDKNACKSSINISIKGQSGSDCKKLVLVLSENNANNVLVFEEKGIAKIFNRDGILVKTMSTPATWDGTLNNGEIIPGLYIMDLNNKISNITIIK